MLSKRFCKGVDFLKLINECIVSDKGAGQHLMDARADKVAVHLLMAEDAFPARNSMYLLISFRQSTPPQNYQLTVYSY